MIRKSQVEQAAYDGVGSKPWARMASATSVTVSVIQSRSASSRATGTFSSSSTYQ